MRVFLRPFGFLIAVILVLSGASAWSEEEAAGEEQVEAPEVTPYENLELFTRVMEVVKDKYLEDVDRQDLIYGALHGMLSSLDPYSQFMEPEIYSEMKVETKGQFGGLGIEITIRDDVLTVITPIEDTPASRAGLLPGDKIVKIEDESTKKITLMEAVKKLRGEPGTDVNITVLRPGEKEFLDFKITRAIIKIDSVKEARLIEDKIGYIRLAQFQENTVEEFDDALEDLEAEGMNALVLDLRYNPGGLLSTSIKVADRFLEEGKVIVQTRGRNDVIEMEVKSTSRNVLPDIPIVVLVNEGSASGSEIVAGALRDNNRAVLVGNTTFGKGSVQSVLPLSEDSAIRLTTGRYHTAAHRAIEDEGIEPDIKVVMTDKEKADFYLKKYRALEELEEKIKEAEEEGKTDAEAGETDAEEIEEEDETVEKEEVFDPQLSAAVDILKGILIFQAIERDAEAES